LSIFLKDSPACQVPTNGDFERKKKTLYQGKQEAFKAVKTAQTKIKVTAGHNIIQP
jgi:hypothetical protein